jgi:hypothetical protein
VRPSDGSLAGQTFPAWRLPSSAGVLIPSKGAAASGQASRRVLGDRFHRSRLRRLVIALATFRASAPALVDANARDRFRPRGCVRSDRRAHDRVQQKGGVERRQNRALAFTQTRAPESGPPSAHSGQGSTSRGPRAARSCVASRISSASLPACFTANAARSGRRQSECITRQAASRGPGVRQPQARAIAKAASQNSCPRCLVSKLVSVAGHVFVRAPKDGGRTSHNRPLVVRTCDEMPRVLTTCGLLIPRSSSS